MPSSVCTGLVTVLSAVLCSAYALAAPPEKAPARVVWDESNPMPKYMTPEERLLPFPSVPREAFEGRVPPTGAVYCPPEYEPNAGMFIAWEGYTSLLQQMTVTITTEDPEAVVYVVVDSTSEQSSAYSSLSSAGADMSQVEFIVRTTDTVWIRDYGPRFIFEDGVRTIIDHTYNRPRPNDNLLNDYISTLWGVPQYDIPLTHGGGNFHLFSNGDAFMSSLILSENPGLSEQDVIDLYHDYQNLNLTIYPGFPTSFDSTRHIDMWMLPLGDNKVIIGEYAPSTGQPYTITENAVTDLVARGYTVYRTPGWNSGGTHYTYTNGVILNDLMFVPKFNVSQDATALAVFQSALPAHQMIQVDCSSIIHAAGAIHCIVMHMPAYIAGLSVTPMTDLEASGNAGGPFTPDSIVYTLENTTENPLDYSVTHSEAWVSVTNPSGTLPALGTTTVEVSINSGANSLVDGIYEDVVNFTNLTTGDGDTVRHVILTVGVPALRYSFNMDSDPGWTTEGLWAWGEPAGLGGEHGGPDPTSGYTGDNVYGYNLNGDYEPNLPERNLTSGPLDCTGLEDVTLSFRRWLGVEQPTYDHAYLRVSNDGDRWTTIWQNTATIEEYSWSFQEYDISAIADGQPTVYLRWTMGETDDYWHYCGWNIDDIEIWALGPGPAPPGDLDTDGDIDLSDFGLFVPCLGGPDVSTPPAMCDADTFAECDLDQDSDVDGLDLQAFFDVFTGPPE